MIEKPPIGMSTLTSRVRFNRITLYNPILKEVGFAYLDWDGIIFDCAVEPDPELEVYP